MIAAFTGLLFTLPRIGTRPGIAAAPTVKGAIVATLMPSTAELLGVTTVAICGTASGGGDRSDKIIIYVIKAETIVFIIHAVVVIVMVVVFIVASKVGDSIVGVVVFIQETLLLHAPHLLCRCELSCFAFTAIGGVMNSLCLAVFLEQLDDGLELDLPFFRFALRTSCIGSVSFRLLITIIHDGCNVFTTCAKL